MKLKPIKTSEGAHALLSPSAAKKWLSCPASMACEVGTPNESGAAAVNGTAMHFMAESVLRVIKEGGYGPDFGVNTWFKVAEDCEATVIRNYGKGPIGMSDNGQPGNVPVTEDFVTQVTKYVNYCTPIMAAAELVEIEAKVSLTRLLHPGFEHDGKKLETFGTADFVALLKQPAPADGSFTLVVGDLKTGRHKVHAAENKQMMLYALGLLRKYSRTYEISAVKMFIFQPYAGGADEWDTTPTALEQFGKFASKRALMALDAYQRGKKGLKPADFRPSGDACQWCRFSEQCNAKTRAASNTMDALLDLSDSIEMTPAQLKAEWDKLPLMRKHIDDIEKAMYASLMRGDKVEGLKLVEGREGNRSWTDPKLVIAKFGDKVMVESIMTPTAALKAIPESELAEFIVRKPGQPSIATADDKRPAWSPVTDEDLS